MAWALRALAIAGLLALPFLPWDGFPGDEDSEAAVKGILSVLSLALVGLGLLRDPGPRGRATNGPLVLAALIAIATYFNLGIFHTDRFHHDWEQFHYTLGARYFPELGYDGLYAASVQAQIESPVEGKVPHSEIRDLRTNQVVETFSPEARAHAAEVEARFTEERWRRFVEDHDHFVRDTSPSHLASMRLDHGFNPPPSWTFVARLFVGNQSPLDGARLGALGAIDYVLLAFAFAFAGRAFGGRDLCLALVLFGLSYPGRFFWVGGALLRHDWLAAVILGVALMERRRFAWAGAALGWAASVRLFPALFLLGPAIVAARALIRRERPTWALRLGAGFAAAVLAALLAGALTGRGFGAWREFTDAIRLHRDTWLTNNVGFENVLLYDLETMRRELVDFSLPEPWIHWQAKMDALRESRAPMLLIGKALLVILFGFAVAGRDPPRATALGVFPIFVVFLSTCYYWQMLLLVAFAGSLPLLIATLLLNAAMWGLHPLTAAFEARYGLFSWGLLLVLGGWLALWLRGAIRRARDRGAAGRAA
ncbi:MAG TPA: hypothetical protein VMT85_05270 [Thermoanaerobaculia bacterium]|nr:hypothetical protein [Thermoanaerobaculia bacterium]